MKYVVAGTHTGVGWVEKWFEALGPFKRGDSVYLNAMSQADPDYPADKRMSSNYVGAAIRMTNKLPESSDPLPE